MGKSQAATTTPVDHLLKELWDRGATDLLLTAGARPLIRVDGMMVPVSSEAPLKPEDTDKVVFGMLNETLTKQYELSNDVDFSFNWQGVARFRANAFRQRGSCALALRLIPYSIPTFEDLGLPPVVEEWCKKPQGLVLVTGPTGAGKSTTQAAMIDYINTHRACHILTLEDPIEYVHRHKRAAVNQREIGEDTEDFPRGLRAALREDPDVLLVGEMRDLETIRTTLTIAETGHLVLATLHTNDTAQALDRIVDVFPGEQQNQVRIQLANTLIGAMYQRLIPRVGGGRVAAFEIMVGTHGVKNMLREGKTRQLRNVVSTSQKDGMQTIEIHLSSLVQEGTIAYEEALLHSMYPQEVRKN
ncbi:MAG: type IV pilus twitching motility protein PilT [Actinomycetota bacterium]